MLISRKELLSFISTLVATLIGVFIAIWLTNIGVKKKENEDTIKLLSTCKSILNSTDTYAKNLSAVIQNMEADSLHITPDSLDHIKEKNPIPYPNQVEQLFSNELISKNVSELVHRALYNNLINLRKVAQYSTVNYYSRILEEMVFLIDLERDRLQGPLEGEQLQQKYEEEIEALEEKYSDTGPEVLEVKTN